MVLSICYHPFGAGLGWGREIGELCFQAGVPAGGVAPFKGARIAPSSPLGLDSMCPLSALSYLSKNAFRRKQSVRPNGGKPSFLRHTPAAAAPTEASPTRRPLLLYPPPLKNAVCTFVPFSLLSQHRVSLL